MLSSPGVSHFQWQASNYTLSPGVGTALTADVSAHTKGSDTALLAGIAEDGWDVRLWFTAGNTDATIRRQMTDILIDPAAGIGNAGSSWSPLINNVYTNGPSVGAGHIGHQFYFPLFLKAGTAIGARVQDVVGGATVRCGIRINGRPTRPELLKAGTRVQTLGATTASTTGVAVTPGNAAMGSSSASLGTLDRAAWWWQLGIGSADTTMNVQIYGWDVLAQAAANVICVQGISYHVTSSTGEGSGKTAEGERPPIRCVPSGEDVYVRAWCGSTPDSSMTAVVYAVS